MNEGIKIKLGGDATRLAQILRGAKANVAYFASDAEGKFGSVSKGFGIAARAAGMFAIAIGLAAKAGDIFYKGKAMLQEYTEWWKAFAKGGMKGVEALGDFERATVKARKANKERWDEEEKVAKKRAEMEKEKVEWAENAKSEEQKLIELKQKDYDLQVKVVSIKTSGLEKETAEHELAKNRKALNEQQLKIEESKSREAKAQANSQREIAESQERINDAKSRVADAQKDLKDRNKEESRYTLEELAKMNMGSDSDKARKATSLEQRAEELKKAGKPNEAQALLDEQDRVINGVDQETDPEAIKSKARIDLMRKQTTTPLAKNGNIQAIAALQSVHDAKFGGIKDLKDSERGPLANLKKDVTAAMLEYHATVEKNGGSTVKPVMGR